MAQFYPRNALTPNLKGSVQYSDEIQFQMLVKKIINDYGSSFKYFEELQKGLFKFDRIEKKGYFLNIINDKGDIVKSIHLYKEQYGNSFILNYNKKELEKHIDNNKLSSSIGIHLPNRVETMIERNILKDQIIIQVQDYRDFKVFNKSVALAHLVDQDEIASPLYELLLDSKILPYYDYAHNQYKPKVVSVDPLKSTIIYGDQNVDPYSGEYVSKYYCTLGGGNNNVAFPTSITYGRSYTVDNFTVYPIYVADQNNSRIIKSNFLINNTSNQTGYFDANSFQVVSENIYTPFDVEYFEASSENNDKIWVSEDVGTRSIICLNADGTINTKIKGFRYPPNQQTQYTFPFEPGAKIRIAIYKPMNCFAFVYSVPGTSQHAYDNEICTFLLDSNGTPLNMYNDSIVIGWNEHFNSDYPLTSVNFQNINYWTESYPYMWITTGGFNPSSPYYNMVHAFCINSCANFGYLASTGRPRGSDWYFHNLLNSVTGLGFYDLFTIEEWDDNYGLRKYYPFADIHSDYVTNYCDDSTDCLYWKGMFTNDCFAKIWAYRKVNQINPWEPVEIERIDGFNQAPGTFSPVIFRLKGGFSMTVDDPLEIKLKLPLEDYILGNEIKIIARLYPDYAPNATGDSTYREYNVHITKNCNPLAGGCPYLYVNNSNGSYQVDNNILHRSEFDEYQNQDIRDLYKLQVNPSTFNNEVSVAVVENEGDQCYFDQFRMYVIDHPEGTIAGVTEDNAVVVYNPSDVISTDSAVLSNISGFSDITHLIQYTSSNGVNAFAEDSTYAHYPFPGLLKSNKRQNETSSIIRNIDISKSNDKNAKQDLRNEEKQSNAISDLQKFQGINNNSANRTATRIALIAYIGNLDTLVPTGQKNWAADITASSYDLIPQTFTGKFARREKMSEVILPLFSFSAGIGSYVNDLKLNWTNNAKLKYLAIVPIDVNYSTTEIPLIEAIHTTDGNVYDNLSDMDSWYSELDSTAIIKLKFSTASLSDPPLNYVRDYIFETNGRYAVNRTKDYLHVSGNQIPLTNKLYNNYPNPFNPSTDIKYEINKNVMVKLVIYNILGQEVKTLVNELKKAGSYKVKFDGSNLASGVYFYRLEAGDFVEAKKMVLVK